MLSATAVQGDRGRLPSAGERRGALPFPDLWILIPALLLLVLGLLMVASASIPIGVNPKTGQGQPFHFLIRQASFALAGLLAAGIVFQVPMARWRRFGPVLLVAALGLLVLVLIPGVGKEVNGSIRWIGVGPINVQVSEIAKLFALIYVAGYLKRHGAQLQTADFKTSALALARPMGVLAVFAVLLLLEPDFGSVVVLMATALGMVFLAGVNLWQFGALQAGTVAVMALLILSSPYRQNRVLSFLNPWDDPFGKGYQLAQSLIAVGRGELFGVGLGQSVQKLFYLPEAHTDFLFAVFAEEFGLIGAGVLLLLYLSLISRGFVISASAGTVFQRLLAGAVSLSFFTYVFVNMGMVTGIVPVVGVPLPIMSYGGTALVTLALGLGILMSISRHRKLVQT